MIAAFLVAFGTVFLAELPDKTMVASLVLTTKFRRPFAVWIGVSGAFIVHVVLAVSIGSLLRRLPETPVKLAVAAMFFIGGLLLLRGGKDDDEDGMTVPADVSFRRVALTSASVWAWPSSAISLSLRRPALPPVTRRRSLSPWAHGARWPRSPRSR